MSKLTPLSASRLKTAQTCSWIYWCKYKLHLPDKSNDGASRGTICHLVFECLGNPRHQSHYKKIIKSQSTKGSPAVWRLILSQARKLNVADEDNLDLIDKMTVNGLNYDFFGEDLGKPTEGISEKSFIIEVNEGETLGDVHSEVIKKFPKLAQIKNSTLKAVDVDYQTDDFELSDGDEVSLFPPVQGG